MVVFLNYTDAAWVELHHKPKSNLHIFYDALHNGHREEKKELYANKVHILGILNLREWKYISHSCVFWLWVIFYH